MITPDHLQNRQTVTVDDDARVPERLTCASCGEAFVFDSGEHQFSAVLGFVPPRHCRPCRAERRRLSQKGHPR